MRRNFTHYLLVLDPEANLRDVELRNCANNGHWKEELSICVPNRAAGR